MSLSMPKRGVMMFLDDAIGKAIGDCEHDLLALKQYLDVKSARVYELYLDKAVPEEITCTDCRNVFVLNLKPKDEPPSNCPKCWEASSGKVSKWTASVIYKAC